MALSSFKTVCRFSGFKIHRNFSAAFPAPSVYPHRETQRGAVSTAGYVPESRLRYSDDANTQTEFTLPRATLSAADRRRRKSSDEQRDVVWAIGKAQELCKADRYAIGSFTPDLYSQAKDALDAFLKDRDCSNLEAVNGSFDLMERLVREIAFLKNSKQSNWLCNPRYYNPFFNKWKEAAVRGEKVISARDLVKKLQTMSTQLPEFNYNIMTVNMIMYVVIKQAPPRRAPFVAESLLEFARNEATQMNSADLKPNAFTYSMLLKAWAESKLPEAPRRLEAIMIDMRPDVAPNLVSYNILLRFFAGNGEVDKVEEILEAMEHEGIKPNTQSLSEAIYCYAKVRQTEKAEKLFQRVINEHTGGTSRELNFIGECVQNILLAYLRDASSYGTTKIRKKQAVACAEALVRKIKITGIIDTESYDKILGRMMDIYACVGRLDKAESIFENLSNPDVYKYGILIKAYARSDKADRAMEFAHRMLKESRIVPNVMLYTTLIDAWAESSHDNAVEQAFQVFRLIGEDEKCLALGVRPNTSTFSSLLKCLAASKLVDAGRRAESILDEMERRYDAGDPTVKPNAIAYTLAINACFSAGDIERADAVMKRMEKSDTPPNIRTYNDILNNYSKMGTAAAAERTEQILEYMKDLAKDNSSLHPDVFSYSIVLGAWARSGDPHAADRMWKIYEKLAAEKIGLSMTSYSTLIHFLAKSTKEVNVMRADLLLQSMENSDTTDTRPDHHHFIQVIKGWIAIADTENAAVVLIRFIEAYRKGDSDIAKPLPAAYHMVLRSWLKSGDLVKATSFLEKIEGLHDTNSLSGGPDIVTYKTLLAAWTKTKHPSKDAYTVKLRNKICSITG